MFVCCTCIQHFYADMECMIHLFPVCLVNEAFLILEFYCMLMCSAYKFVTVYCSGPVVFGSTGRDSGLLWPD